MPRILLKNLRHLRNAILDIIWTDFFHHILMFLERPRINALKIFKLQIKLRYFCLFLVNFMIYMLIQAPIRNKEYYALLSIYRVAQSRDFGIETCIVYTEKKTFIVIKLTNLIVFFSGKYKISGIVFIICIKSLKK